MSARTQDSGSCKKYGEMLFLKKWKSEYFTVQPLILKKKKKKNAKYLFKLIQRSHVYA